MENAATDDKSGHDCGGGGGGRTAVQDSVQSVSVSTVTEVGSSGNAAAAEETRRPGLDDGDHGEDEWLTVLERNAVHDYYDPVEAEVMAAVGRGAPSSPLRLAVTRFGCLLLGFLAGAAATVLFLMRDGDSPVTTCTVVPT